MSYSIFGTTPTSNLMSVAEAASKVMGLEEALKPRDKKIIDAFYNKKVMDGPVVSTNGNELYKLGMGAQPPTPEWGTMLAEAREFILRAWWVVTLPGIAILVTVLAINLMGDGLRDALDPKLKRS